MKTYVTESEFKQVLALLGLPSETLAIEIGDRGRWQMTGVNSSWALRATLGDAGSYDAAGKQLEPYAERVIYVPVMIPGDEARLRAAQLEFGRRFAEVKHRRPVEQVDLVPDADVG